MSRMSYGRAFGWWAERAPEAPVVIFEDQVRTRAQLESASNRRARLYLEAGVASGDRVTIALPNGPEFFECCLAAWKLGATPSPVSSHLPEIERRAIIEVAEPAFIAGAPKGRYGATPSHPVGFAAPGEIDDAPLPDVIPRNARALASGGSTGRPKLIVTTEPAVCDPEVPPGPTQANGPTLIPGPLYHAGPFMASWQSIFSGGCVVLMPRFDALRALALMEEHRIDWVLFVPTMMQRIWRLPRAERERFDLSALRIVMCTGAPSAEWLKRAWIDWLGPERIFEAYGGSERIAGTMISGSEWLAHPGSVGKPTAGRRVRVLDAEGHECPPGVMGEVFMMPPGGQGSTYRYVGDEDMPAFDGWESLGDLGKLDEEGYLYLGDRKSDMILCGGANVFPAEVEAAIDAHPAVRSSAVIGLPDDDLGSRIHALVDAPGGLDEAELCEHLEAQLVRYKIPRSFEFCDEPLRDDAGKVRRSALREARIAKGRESEAQEKD